VSDISGGWKVTCVEGWDIKDMLSIWQWAIAYDICMFTYMTNHLNSVLELIKYGNNIRNMAKQVKLFLLQ
jgi:hypothetical protein